MSTTVWIGGGVAVWLILAVAVALLIGAMIRSRDGEVARPEQRRGDLATIERLAGDFAASRQHPGSSRLSGR
jgi:hypothetical protein